MFLDESDKALVNKSLPKKDAPLATKHAHQAKANRWFEGYVDRYQDRLFQRGATSNRSELLFLMLSMV